MYLTSQISANYSKEFSPLHNAELQQVLPKYCELPLSSTS